jgi:transcriptional regulator with XRE-family HTH domain
MKTGQVFVSHTSDMAQFPVGRSFVQAALDAVSRAGMAPVDMRHFAAQDETPADYCQRRARECEVYVVVVGFQYGSQVPGETVSYTELEFQAATTAGIPRLVFLLDETADPSDPGEGSADPAGQFRQRLRAAGLIVRTFTSADGLELEIFHALSELSRATPAQSPVTFAALLQQWRTEIGLTPQELAQRARLSLVSVSELEHGRADIAEEATVRLLADALKLTGSRRTQFTAAAARLPAQPPGSSILSSAAGPRIWNAPRRNTDFTGRDDILRRLHDDLASDGAAVVLARAVYGLGGVGKTQIALEYAHRFKSNYDLIWWINAEQPQEVSLTLAELAGRLGLQISNSAEAAATVLDQLRRDIRGRWLLIFDNAEDPEELDPFLPTGSGHIIITSRNQGWTRHAEPLELDVFTREETVAHLMRHVPGLSAADAQRVSEAVGDLPLAVEQAAAWLAETRMPPARYAAWLETQAATALGLNKPFDYAMPVVATWNLSFDRLKQRSPAAIRLLQILAFCSPGPIDMDLLYSDEMNECLLPFDETLSEKLMLGRVIRDISRFALVTVDQGTNSLQIHRLVQAVIRSQLSQQEQVAARHEVHKILTGARPRQGETDDPANWSTYDIIWPHLVPSLADECDDPRTRQLLIDWVRYQWKHGEFESGIALGRRLEKLWTKALGADHEQTLHLQFQIGNILRSLGRFTAARELNTYVLERQRTLLGADHPHALITANGLAADVRALGNFQESLVSDQATYESFREQFGADYPRTLIAAHNLGCALRLVGDYSAALRLDEDTLARQQQVFRDDHPDVLLSMASLALDLRAAGVFRESVRLLRETWHKYRDVLGDDMTETLRTATSLAVSLRKVGQQSEAMTLAQNTYERYKRRYGIDAPDAQSCALNLACDYAALGDMAQALDLVTGVKAAHQATLGDDHPNTLVAANNEGCYLRCVGRLPEAIELTGDTLHRMRRKLGDKHPLTLPCAVNLASCHGDSGDHESAEALEGQTIALLRDVMGPDHPDTLAVQANLAVTLGQAGRDQEADELRTSISPDFSRVLGANHPDTAHFRAGQRIYRDLEEPQI